MKKVIKTERIPILMWLDDIESGAEQQAKNLASLPFAFKHIAIMPDCHSGYGMPIGGVLATEGVVIPNAVGVDIGCGMCAVRTSLGKIDKKDLESIVSRIRQVIPKGPDHHKVEQDLELLPDLDIRDLHIVKQEFESAARQIGTLGSGNHFIEIQKGSDGHIWIMIHSGSRNLGKKVADHYNKLAIRNSENYPYKVERSKDLAYFPLGSEEAKAYMREMEYCVDFALHNRKLMLKRVSECFVEVVGNVEFGELINIAHNYARKENHFGKEVIVHRKGATSAARGEIGIIPGSQGTASYIVKGLGNPDSFMSCSHGAGRLMSRNAARKNLDLQSEINAMNKKGIIHGIRGVKDLDEAASAYKDIDEVMKNQEDLVDILTVLTPLAVVKG